MALTLASSALICEPRRVSGRAPHVLRVALRPSADVYSTVARGLTAIGSRGFDRRNENQQAASGEWSEKINHGKKTIGTKDEKTKHT